jgi:hypothetical protein
MGSGKEYSYALHVDVDIESPERIGVEIVLVILKDVEDTLYGCVAPERQAEFTVTFVGGRFLCNEEEGLHVPEVVTRTGSIFLEFEFVSYFVVKYRCS